MPSAFVGELRRIAEHLSQFSACRLEVVYERGCLEERTGDQCGGNLTGQDVARVVNSDDNAPLGELTAAFEQVVPLLRHHVRENDASDRPEQCGAARIGG